jgi:hypothetical protein
MLREQAPELYDLWLKIAQEKAATANYVDRAPYEVPERLAQSGRPRALGALIIVLSFCGYLAWLGGPGIYIGGVIAILDLIAMLAVLFALRPDRLAEPRRAERPRRRRLPAAAAYPPRGPAPAPPALSPPPPTGREEPQTASVFHRCARRGPQRNNPSLCLKVAALVVRMLRECRAALPLAWQDWGFHDPGPKPIKCVGLGPGS